ncbi:class I SAM-dependent methyltransferase [Dactylosporangium sp. NPDC049140]|uniref:class I SAM-dependent methyltransferase n=1 Tax=Dactylosporangium sp. NPDC049140 TaxID=3155647 RepID=UPI0033E20171
MSYDQPMAARYDRGRSLQTADVERWMDAARPYLPDAGGRILDLGAGTGRFSTALACATGATVVACEPSTAMRAAFPAGAAFVVGGTAEAAPFRDNAFDAVWASQVVHHVADLAAFAATVRRVLRPGGHLLIRGGFGPVQRLPLYRWFPSAWAANSAVRLSLDRIAAALAAAGVIPVARIPVSQVFATTTSELEERVVTRSLSNLATLPDEDFHAGLAALRRDVAAGRIEQPLVDHLDLVVFAA